MRLIRERWDVGRKTWKLKQRKKKDMKKQILLILVIGLVVVGGCRKPGSETKGTQTRSYDPAMDPLVNPPSLFEPAPQDRSQIATDETLLLQLDGSPSNLNPIFASSAYEQIMTGALFAGPFTFDKDLNWMMDEEFVASFEESEDHTTFILKINEGFRWHDGEPLTAHDIVFSWEQIIDPCVPCPAVKTGTIEITSCEALDDYTVRYVQDEPLGTRLWNLNFPIIPRHIYEKEKQQHPDLLEGEYYNQQNRNPVGSGPYRIVAWKENDRIEVERWDDYQGSKPHFKRIVFKIVPDNNVALLNFEKGDIDVLERLTPQQFAFETSESEAFKAIGYKGLGRQWSYGYIGWNMDGSNPFFKDKRVRYAMTHAFDMPRVLKEVYFNLHTQCQGIFHPDSWMFNPEVELLQYDLDKARRYLDEAGWQVDQQNGWRYKDVDGKRVKFEFTLLVPQGSPTSPKIAANFQEDLKRLGIIMKTRIIEWASFMKQVRNHEFEAQIAGWGTGADPDTNWNLWHSSEYEDGRNYGGYKNERVDELFEIGRQVFEREKRQEAYQEIHKIIYEDQPYLWIANAPILAAVNQRVHGIAFSPRGIFSFTPGMYAWWIAAEN